MNDTLLPLRAAGTSSAAYTAGYTPMMLNSAVKTVFTCTQATGITQRLYCAYVGHREQNDDGDAPAPRRSRRSR